MRRIWVDSRAKQNRQFMPIRECRLSISVAVRKTKGSSNAIRAIGVNWNCFQDFLFLSVSRVITSQIAVTLPSSDRRLVGGKGCRVTEIRVASTATEARDCDMAQGTIKRLTDKGFGFIEVRPGKDMFFHLSSVEGCQFDDLQEGQKVEFNEGEGPKGPRAENVRVID